MQHAARSAPDGYTLVVCAFTQLAVNPWMFSQPAYDPVADFSPVTVLFASQALLANRPDATIGSFAVLLEAARARPGRLSYGSSGIGQPPHVMVGRRQREIARALEAPDVRAAQETGGRRPVGNPPEAFAAMIRDSVPKWRGLVHVAGLKPE